MKPAAERKQRMPKPIRWSDNDKYFGFITYSRNRRSYNPLAIVLDSGCDEYPRCRLRVSAFGRTVICPLPAIIKPWRKWIDTSHYKWSKGNGGYWDTHSREYGFSYSDGFLQVFLGPQTHDSTTTKSWCKHLPWTQWRHVRHSLYDLAGNHYATLPDWRLGDDIYEKRKAIEDGCPTRSFAFHDYDGERLTVTTRIEEREWRFGTGWFKWLSVFRKPRICRSLDLRFSGEVGKEKGSWKGGTVGHSIEMLPGELHESAFRRYCQKEHTSKSGPFMITFIEPEAVAA